MRPNTLSTTTHIAITETQRIMKKFTKFASLVCLMGLGIAGCQDGAGTGGTGSGTAEDELNQTISGVKDAVERTEASVEQHMQAVEEAAQDTLKSAEDTAQNALDGAEQAAQDTIEKVEQAVEE
jgi:methyl-accepting chemotaxis protein